MPGDDEIARLLPDPPPPRAARRDAAIDAAMRRFDGEAPAGAAAPLARPARRWVGGPQMAAFASVALVAVVGIPLALNALRQEHQQTAAVHQPAARVAQGAASSGSGEQPGAIANTALAQKGAGHSTPAGKSEAAPPVIEMPPPPERDCGKGECADIVNPPPIDRFAALKPARQAAPAAAPPQEAAASAGLAGVMPAPAPKLSANVEASRDMREVVVTGSRMSVTPRPIEQPRVQWSGWDACTVNDTGHNLAGCKGLVDPGAAGAAGQAAIHVTAGLTRSWNRDFAGAANEFDAAIRLQPRLAIAWLNRGLAYQRLGDKRRALSDLDKAVRLAPRMALAYYSRYQIRRDAGDWKGADADLERAGQIDPRYIPQLD